MVPYSCVLCGCLCRRMRKGGLLQCFWAHSLAIYLINNSYHIPHSFSSLKPTMRKYSYAYLWIGFKLNDSPSQNFLCVCLSVHPLASLEVKLIRYFSMLCWFIPKLVNFRVEIAKNNIFWKSNSKCRFTWAPPPLQGPLRVNCFNTVDITFQILCWFSYRKRISMSKHTLYFQISIISSIYAI